MSLTCVSFEVAGGEAYAGLPVVERDTHFVAARRQRADVNFATYGCNSAWAHANVILGDALTGVHVYDVYCEGMVFEEVIIRTADGSLQTQQGLLTA